MLGSTLKNLARFQTESQLQRATLAFIVSQIMSSDELAGLREAFLGFDKDGDGRLNKEEIEEAMNKHTGFSNHNIRELIEKVDLNNSGQIDYSEFLAATINWENELSKERLEQAFHTFDSDNSGKISIDELEVAFGGTQHNRQVFKDMFKEADTNGDGEIDLEEFCNYMNLFKVKAQNYRNEARLKKDKFLNFY